MGNYNNGSIISTITFKNRNHEPQSSDITNWRGRIRRTPFYFIALAFLFVGTLFVFIALLTNNWQRTRDGLLSSANFTFGLWYMCRQDKWTSHWYSSNWYSGYSGYQGPPGDRCFRINYDNVSWIYACQVFYVLAAIISFFSLVIAFAGICVDFVRNKLGIPAFLFWALIVSLVFQLIAVCVYGGMGVGDYSMYEPDYSLILACIALGINFLSICFFCVEIFFYYRKTHRHT